MYMSNVYWLFVRALLFFTYMYDLIVLFMYGFVFMCLVELLVCLGFNPLLPTNACSGALL